MIDLRVVTTLDGQDRQDLPNEGVLKTLQLSRVLLLWTIPLEQTNLPHGFFFPRPGTLAAVKMADNALFLELIIYISKGLFITSWTERCDKQKEFQDQEVNRHSWKSNEPLREGRVDFSATK